MILLLYTAYDPADARKYITREEDGYLCRTKLDISVNNDILVESIATQAI